MELIKENSVKRGRPCGSITSNVYKWKVIMYNKDTNSFNEGKYTSVADINRKLGLNLNGDYVKRIMTKYRVDMTKRNKENSFLEKWGHIKIEKINEKV